MGFKDFFAPKISEKNLEHVKKLLKKSTECASLSNTTCRPDIFFAKYDELENLLAELVAYEKYKIFKGTLPSTNLKNVKDNRKNDTNAFIQRSYSLARKKADAEKDKEKRNKIFTSYFADLEKYGTDIDEFNLQVIEDLKLMSIE